MILYAGLPGTAAATGGDEYCSWRSGGGPTLIENEVWGWGPSDVMFGSGDRSSEGHGNL